MLVFPLVSLHALLHVELLELLHLGVGLPGDEEAGVARELLPLLRQAGGHCTLLQHLLQAHVATHLRTFLVTDIIRDATTYHWDRAILLPRILRSSVWR